MPDAMSDALRPRSSLPRLLATFAALAASSGCAASDRDVASVKAYWMPAQVDGGVKITQGGVAGSGTRVRVDDDLGMGGESQGIFGAGMKVDNAWLTLEYMPFSFSGSDQPAQSFTFHGQNFAAGDHLKSDLGLETWHARLAAPLGDADGALNAGIGAYWWDFDMKVADRDTGAQERRSFSRLLPAASLDGRASVLDHIGVGFDASFATLGGGRKLTDLAAFASYSYGSGFEADLGYREIHVALNEDTNDGTLIVRGPYFGVSWRF